MEQVDLETINILAPPEPGTKTMRAIRQLPTTLNGGVRHFIRYSSQEAARDFFSFSSRYLLNSSDLFLGTLKVCQSLALKCFAR